MLPFARTGDLIHRPDGWWVTPLKAVVVHLSRGMTPKYSEEPTGYRAFNQKCTRPDRTLDPGLGRWQGEPSEGEWERSCLEAGDIVMNSTGHGTLGRAGIVEPEHLDIPTFADSHVTIVRVDESRVLPRYLWYVLSTDIFYEFANETLAVGSTAQTELSSASLGDLRFALPTFPEQHAAVARLDSATRQIAALLAEQQRQQRLLAEHRTAIVVAATTGHAEAS